MTTQLDLSSLITEAMTKVGISAASVDRFKQDPNYINSTGKHPNIQRTLLTVALYDLLISQPKPVPTNIRVALNAANDNLYWYEDMLTILLPFIQVNEDKFFPTVH